MREARARLLSRSRRNLCVDVNQGSSAPMAVLYRVPSTSEATDETADLAPPKRPLMMSAMAADGLVNGAAREEICRALLVEAGEVR